MKPADVLVIVFFVCLVGFLFYGFLLVRLWMRAALAGAPIPLVSLLGMRLRQSRAGDIVDAYIVARKAEVDVSVDELEMHSLAGGNVLRLVAALAAAAEAGIPLNFRDACAIDLAGRDVVEEVRACQTARTLHCPDPLDQDKAIEAVSADGVRLKARAAMTVRPRLVLGAGTSVSGAAKEMADTIKDIVATARGGPREQEAFEVIAGAMRQMPVEQEGPRPTLAAAAGASDPVLVGRVANAIKDVLADADGRSALDAPEAVARTVREMRVDQETALEILALEVTIEEAADAWRS